MSEDHLISAKNGRINHVQVSIKEKKTDEYPSFMVNMYNVNVLFVNSGMDSTLYIFGCLEDRMKESQEGSNEM